MCRIDACPNGGRGFLQQCSELVGITVITAGQVYCGRSNVGGNLPEIARDASKQSHELMMVPMAMAVITELPVHCTNQFLCNPTSCRGSNVCYNALVQYCLYKGEFAQAGTPPIPARTEMVLHTYTGTPHSVLLLHIVKPQDLSAASSMLAHDMMQARLKTRSLHSKQRR